MANHDNYIKMDGEHAEFEGGAIRYTKTGKGRFDLIPGDAIVHILTAAWEDFYCEGDMTTSVLDVIQSAYNDDSGVLVEATETIINLVNREYSQFVVMGYDDNGVPSVRTEYDAFVDGFVKMLSELAIHYENGAEKYGPNNWKKGIPVTGGDRGGSFFDSGRRHLNQFLAGSDDEHHLISCIWNFTCAIHVILNENKTKKSEESKSTSNEILSEEDIMRIKKILLKYKELKI